MQSTFWTLLIFVQTGVAAVPIRGGGGGGGWGQLKPVVCPIKDLFLGVHGEPMKTLSKGMTKKDVG